MKNKTDFQISLIDVVQTTFDNVVEDICTNENVKKDLDLKVEGLKNVFVFDCLENNLGLSSCLLSCWGKKNEDFLKQEIESGKYNLGYVIRRWIDCQLHLDSEGSKVTSQNFYETVDNFMTQYDNNHHKQLKLI